MLVYVGMPKRSKLQRTARSKHHWVLGLCATIHLVLACFLTSKCGLKSDVYFKESRVT